MGARGAYVDAGGDMLFRSQEDAEAYRIDRRAAEEPAEPTQAEEGYSGVLRSIRRANDRIADPVLSQKIDRLEEIAGRIFRIIEDEPSKRAQASTFLNYYLPTTQKLLDSYADFEEAGVSGKNLDQAKDKIARTMDNIVAGFEQQLDRLYQSEAMDIDSDIRVMETMLRRDRGTVEDDFGLGRAARPCSRRMRNFKSDFPRCGQRTPPLPALFFVKTTICPYKLGWPFCSLALFLCQNNAKRRKTT